MDFALPSVEKTGASGQSRIRRVCIIGTTAIVLNRICLLAVVGGNKVTNPFVVTEVNVRQDDNWMLAELSFTRLLGP